MIGIRLRLSTDVIWSSFCYNDLLSDCNTPFFVVSENTGSAFAKGRGHSLIQSLSKQVILYFSLLLLAPNVTVVNLI